MVQSVHECCVQRTPNKIVIQLTHSRTSFVQYQCFTLSTRSQLESIRIYLKRSVVRISAKESFFSETQSNDEAFANAYIVSVTPNTTDNRTQ
jgi:hypothetical protein